MSEGFKDSKIFFFFKHPELNPDDVSSAAGGQEVLFVKRLLFITETVQFSAILAALMSSVIGDCPHSIIY